MTKGQSLLAGLLVFAVGGGGYALFQANGFQGFSAGIAASALLMLLVVGWTATYLLRALSGNMTYMQQRRTYREAYDAATTKELERKFAALNPEEQMQLLRETGQLDAEADPVRGEA
jgi:formate hydrogenlyase subunit 3/multisubunit Na+/H+ antiporter MnhD subunit